MCDTCLEEKHAGVIYALHLGDYKFRYIGQSIRHKKRYKNHINEAISGGGYAVHGWIRRHGAENIQMTIIRTFTEEDLHLMNAEEIFYIWQAREYGELENLNLTVGGDGAMSGRIHSEETRAKIRKARALQVITDETRAKMSASHMGNTNLLGHKHSEETRAKMSATRKGKSPWNKGVPNSTGGVGGHYRWHRNRGIIKEGCIYCA